MAKCRCYLGWPRRSASLTITHASYEWEIMAGTHWNRWSSALRQECSGVSGCGDHWIGVGEHACMRTKRRSSGLGLAGWWWTGGLLVSRARVAQLISAEPRGANHGRREFGTSLTDESMGHGADHITSGKSCVAKHPLESLEHSSAQPSDKNTPTDSGTA